MMLTLEAENTAQSHAIRIAIALKGGSLSPYTMSRSSRKALAKGYAKRGRMVLNDRDLPIPSIPIALEYIDEVRPDPALLPKDMSARASIRMFAAAGTGDALDGAEDCSAAALQFWDWTVRAIIKGDGCLSLGVCGVGLSDSMADCVAFPILHRMMAGHSRRDYTLPMNTGFAAAGEWLLQKYGMPEYTSDSLTEAERG